MIQKPLRFVQRGRILVRCGSAFALSLPSLGVSSLDLGRLPTQAALFSLAAIPRGAILHIMETLFLGRRLGGFQRVRWRPYSAAAWNGPRSPSGTAASASAKLAKSLATCANLRLRSRRRS